MIFIGLGSNIGNRQFNLLEAVARLKSKGVLFVRLSSLYSTPPWGNLDQSPFLNMVAKIEFKGTPEGFLHLLLQTENEMGRIREEKWGPRLIDLDLLEFNGREINTKNLILPHPWYTRRAFVLLPFLEIAPDFIPTRNSLSVKELCNNFSQDELKQITRYSGVE